MARYLGYVLSIAAAFSCGAMLLVVRDPVLGHVTDQDAKQSTPVQQAMERPDVQVAKVGTPGLARPGDRPNETISTTPPTAQAVSRAPGMDQSMPSATVPPMTIPAPGPGAPVSASPSAGLVNLNTASLEELNALQGGGLIGRAIIRGRPYTSVDDLLVKQVLNRSTYKRIAHQVDVR